MDVSIQLAELEALYERTLGHGLRSLAITSPSWRSGVSTLAAALARRAAAGGRRTLLVDLNLMRPALDRLVGAQPTAVDWALHDGSAGHALVPATQSNLTLLTPPRQRAFDILSREADTIRQAIAQWQEEWDCVILDCLPVTARNRANLPTPQVCAACQGTILVVLANGTTGPELSAASETLEQAGARLLGAVVNDMNNPSLLEELCREADRLRSMAPILAERIKRWLRGRRLLHIAT